MRTLLSFMRGGDRENKIESAFKKPFHFGTACAIIFIEQSKDCIILSFLFFPFSSLPALAKMFFIIKKAEIKSRL